VSTRDPLVSVGIPTYNRAASLERAVRSALAQTHSNIEVFVCDDASADDTPATLARLAAEDPRVRFERNEQNLGHEGNFAKVARLARGDYFMWLSDDDHLDEGYVAACLAELLGDPSLVLVAGQGRYFRDGDWVLDERAQNLLSERPLVRVAQY
jgi:glycosyltransferase involved in cell wall biosynthesis